MAEYCSLDDAFPASPLASVGCRGTSATAAQSKEERRRARRCRVPQQQADADRPALAQRDGGLDVMRGSGTDVSSYNPATGLYSNQPVTATAVSEESFEQPKSAYGSRKPGRSLATNTVLRETEGPTELPKATAAVPAYFGAGLDDDAADGFLQAAAQVQIQAAVPEPNEMEEGYANFTPSMADENEFMMSADFTKLGKAVGADRAAQSALPIPSIVDEWKHLTPSGARSAVFDALPRPGGEFVLGQGADYSMRKKLDQILARLDDLETAGTAGENNQMEIFMFILSGMFVMFALDIFARK